jgi:hypothetical protein
MVLIILFWYFFFKSKEVMFTFTFLITKLLKFIFLGIDLVSYLKEVETQIYFEIINQ